MDNKTQIGPLVYGLGVLHIADIITGLGRKGFSGPIVIEDDANMRDNVVEVKRCIGLRKTDLSVSAACL